MALGFFLTITLLLLALSFPIFLAILAGTIGSFELFGPPMPTKVIAQRLVEGVNIFSLLAVPLFVFAADIVARGQIGRRLVRLMEVLVGHVTGGLAIATVLTCGLFGAISGIGVAAVVSVGPIVYPALLRQGYGRGFAIGLILSASTLAMMVPPGVAMILYSVQTSNSVAQVFLAGLCTAMLFIVAVSLMCITYARSNGIHGQNRARAVEITAAVKNALWPLGLPAIIFGGIYGGVFTATEAAAAACVYAGFVEIVVYRQMSVAGLIRISPGSSRVIATVLILISVGATMTWYLTLLGLPDQISSWLEGMPAMGILLVINVVFLIAGMFIDPNSAIIVLAPLIYETSQSVGIDPIHLGAVLVFNLAIGMITPPFGLNIFIGMSTFKVGYAEIVKSLLPFIGLTVLVLILVTYVPRLVIWLPELVFK